jgi:hypothetical protein
MAIQWDQGGRPFAALDDFEASHDLSKEWITNDADGQEFAVKYNSPPNVERLAEVLELHGMAVSSQNLSWCYRRLRDSGQLAAPRTPVEPDVPRDRNSKHLSDAQQRWAEMTQFSNEKSMRDINARKQKDPIFADFIRTNIRREMTQEIDGDCRPFNTHLNPQAQPSEAAVNVAASQAGLTVAELQAWAKTYILTSSSQVRLLRGRGANPTGYAQYEKSYQAAIAAGLV